MRAFIVTLIGCGALLVGAALTPAGCGDVDAAFDCQSVCSRYAECYDKGYDVSGCRERCRNAAKNDADIKNKADQCESCIDGMSCVGSTFSCTAPCAAILTL